MAKKEEISWLKEKGEIAEQFAVEVIYDQRSDIWALFFRSVARSLSVVFRGLVWIRHLLYRNRILLRDHHLGVLTISIGNLTVGGTGKTPVVELLARSLQKRGRHVAILSRGYKSQATREATPSIWARLSAFLLKKPPPQKPPPRVVSDGKRLLLDSLQAGDEPYMLAKNLPGVSVVVDKDRVKGGLYAIKHLGADTLLLDDGLQYLRLHHRLDIVLIDSTAPFGTGRLLPRGTLREPRKHLKRASYIIITKCRGQPQDRLISELRRYNKVADIIQSNHVPKSLVDVLSGQKRAVEYLRGKHISAISAIAIPQSFISVLRQLGANVVHQRHYSDHHRFSENEIYSFIDESEAKAVDFIVTTEKDIVRFPTHLRTPVRIFYLRVEIEIIDGYEAWERLLERVCNRTRPPQTVTVSAPEKV